MILSIFNGVSSTQATDSKHELTVVAKGSVAPSDPARGANGLQARPKEESARNDEQIKKPKQKKRAEP